MTYRELIMECGNRAGCENCPYVNAECKRFMEKRDGRAPDEFLAIVWTLDNEITVKEGE